MYNSLFYCIISYFLSLFFRCPIVMSFCQFFLLGNNFDSSFVKQQKSNTMNQVNSQNNYDSLNRYARNLNELASSGKLDPVIGR